MTIEIPQYGLRAYALFFTRHGSKESFKQSELDWIVSQSMKKKIFSLLLRAGWIRKRSSNTYVCVSPEKAMAGLLEFRVPQVIKMAKKEYAFTGLSAIEIWSDYSYVQRSIDKSPYFINVLTEDLGYWKRFFSSNGIPAYVNSGTTVGEYVILKPVEKLWAVEKGGLHVIGLREAEKLARANEIYAYAYKYMREKHGSTAT